MRLAPPPEVEEEPGQFWKDFIRETAPVFRKSTFEQLGVHRPDLGGPARRRAVRRRAAGRDLRRASARRDRRGQRLRLPGDPRQRPALGANRLLQPARAQGPGAAAALHRAADRRPLRLGASTATSTGGHRRDAGRLQRVLRRARGAAASRLGDDPRLPLAQPLPLSGARSTTRPGPLGPTWHNLESSVRTTDAEWTPPPRARRPRGVADLRQPRLAGLGRRAADEELVEALAETPHRYVVSKGPQHAEYELADNMVGEEFLPQVSVLPQVDLVITHGGNNTTTESLHFGKPMVVLPIFWDQHDNAQRIHETGFGIRLPTYSFETGSTGGDRPAARRLATSALASRCVEAAPGEPRKRAGRRADRAAALYGRRRRRPD